MLNTRVNSEILGQPEPLPPEAHLIINAVIKNLYLDDGTPGHGKIVVQEGASETGYPLSQLIASPESDTDSLPVGVLKRNATDGTQGVVDAVNLDFDQPALERLIKQFAGKKDSGLQEAVRTAIHHLSQHPRTDGSEKIQGLGDKEPTFGNQRIALWLFKPRHARALGVNSPRLRDMRIIYGVIDDPKLGPVLAISDIIDRDELGRAYR